MDGQKDKADRHFPIKYRSAWKYIKVYVSRRIKAEKAMECFDVNVENKICMDIGASSGGFTDRLQNGAQRSMRWMWGMDSLHETRNDERVTVMEKTNIR